MKYNERELLIIWIDGFKEIEYTKKRAVYELLADKTDLRRNIESNARSLIGELGENGYNALHAAANQSYLDQTLAELEKAGERAITMESDGYPDSLKNLPEPPLALYAKGNAELLRGKIFGIVGSRRSLPLSLSVAKNFATELVNGGFTLVTGTAEGVDAEVLKAAEKGGRIISVSAGGLNNIYPAANRDLIDRIAGNGLLISERREDVKAQPYFFPIRNRIIAGLAQGVLVVSGKLTSGTMHTAGYCNEYGKDLFAVPYSPGIASGAGPNELIKRGALLADDPRDILSFYGIESPEGKAESEDSSYSDAERRIIAVLKDGALHIEKIAQLTGLQTFEITSALMVLEINGKVYKNGINTYGLIRNREI